jgi:hypothetical protein
VKVPPVLLAVLPPVGVKFVTELELSWVRPVFAELFDVICASRLKPPEVFGSIRPSPTKRRQRASTGCSWMSSRAGAAEPFETGA